MGKLTAQTLREEGADVTVTVRQYRSGMVQIPQGAKRIDYGDRYQYIPICDFVFSATASPNLTGMGNTEFTVSMWKIYKRETDFCGFGGTARYGANDC